MTLMINYITDIKNIPAKKPLHTVALTLTETLKTMIYGTRNAVDFEQLWHQPHIGW